MPGQDNKPAQYKLGQADNQTHSLAGEAVCQSHLLLFKAVTSAGSPGTELSAPCQP